MMQPHICVRDLQHQALTCMSAKLAFPFPMDSKTAMSDLEDEEIMTLGSDCLPLVLERNLGTLGFLEFFPSQVKSVYPLVN